MHQESLTTTYLQIAYLLGENTHQHAWISFKRDNHHIIVNNATPAPLADILTAMVQPTENTHTITDTTHITDNVTQAITPQQLAQLLIQHQASRPPLPPTYTTILETTTRPVEMTTTSYWYTTITLIKQH